MLYSHIFLEVALQRRALNVGPDRAELIRYAPATPYNAKRFYKALPKRLSKYGLDLHLDKSQIIKSGRFEAAKAVQRNTKLKTFNFLGFTCYWGKD